MRTFLAAVAAGLVAVGSVPVNAQDMDALAKSLATTPKPDAPAGDTVQTRQMRLPGAQSASAAATAVAHAVRLNISMTFLKGSADLTAAAKAKLDQLAKALARVGDYRPFTVEGHTDSSGSHEVNMALSQARADAVVHYLAANGVEKTKMTAKGFGPDRTLPGHAPTDAANRRVEVSAS